MLILATHWLCFLQLAIANKYRKFHSKRWGYHRANTMFLKGYIEDLKSVGIPTASQDLVV